MRGRGFAVGVRGHGSGEGERPGEDGGTNGTYPRFPLRQKRWTKFGKGEVIRIRLPRLWSLLLDLVFLFRL